MSEGGVTRERQRTYSPEERIVLNIAEGAIGRIRKNARYYPDIKRLLLKHTLSPKEMAEPTTELTGSRWNYVFTRHSQRYIDLEIKKTPRRVGLDVIEEIIRLRRSVDPLARTSRLTQSKGMERYENDEQAYTQIDTFVEELVAQF